MTKMNFQVQPIATITNASFPGGYVRMKPLSRYFDEYLMDRELFLGYSSEVSDKMTIEFIKGIGKKRRFKFQGVNNTEDAEKLIGQTLFVETIADDKILLICKELLGFKVSLADGSFVGILEDVVWLPANDAYLINNGCREILIPVIPEIINKIDSKNRTISINSMDGLLD